MPGFIPADYEPVEDRLRAFWSDWPYGRIKTDLVSLGASKPGDVILFKASIWRAAWIPHFDFKGQNDPARGEWLPIPHQPVSATGYAHQRLLEKPPPKRNGEPNVDAPEWTSPWEVAETSAIGRALANLGYAAKGKRPSRDEISKASTESTRPLAGKQAPPNASPASVEGSVAGSDPSHGAEPTSSAAPDGAGTEAGGARQDSTSYGEGEAGTEGSPQPPTSRARRDQLWENLVQFAGTKRKALNAVNTTMKASWTEGHIADIPEDDIENTLKAYMQREGVA
jgi:hypothetical protein